jgi:glycosyltransferase involved in cell wall biosynthesis
MTVVEQLTTPSPRAAAVIHRAPSASVEQARFAVIQLGARRHYAVPRALHAAGQLQKLYTDFVSVELPAPLVSRLPKALQRAASRRLPLPAERVRAFPGVGVRFAAWRRLRPQTPLPACLWAGQRLCELALRDGLDGANAVYTYNTAGLEVLREGRRRGAFTVLDQTIAPYTTERELMAQERETFPGWEAAESEEAVAEYEGRERQEWSHADRIICGSQFVADEIARLGGPAERCRVVPSTAGAGLPPMKRSRGARLRVLYCGAVGLRKGAPYVLAAAQRLKAIAEFRMVGAVNVLPAAAAELAKHVELLGPVPRQAVREHYQWANVLLLPSLCEGSAGVTYEAMSTGLPVVVTPNAGSIAVHGEHGFIVPIRHVEAICDALAMLHTRRELLEAMSSRAAQAMQSLNPDRYGRDLLRAMQPPSFSPC